ncbi:MAG: ribonuclease HI [Prolixibacteraceae bacterium]|nr:ribonuclease HI [Prolixibacteraceae bacterium]
MKVIKLIICIETIGNGKIGCQISNTRETALLEYAAENGSLFFEQENGLAEVIRRNHFQFEKIMRSAIKGNIKVGQIINAVFIEGFTFLNDADFNKVIRVDRRNEKLHIIKAEQATPGIHKIYADGSFTEKSGKSGYGGFIETPDGKQELFCQSFEKGSSNLMELLAVTDGLERLTHVKKVQVNTDSRFVIRGLAQWVHFWRHNNWQTAYGCNVKYAKQWQHIDRLCEGKFLEFIWIKGHSGHELQSFCDELAKDSAGTKPYFRL